MSVDRLRVFVSSKMDELAAERKTVKEALAELLVDAWVFEADAGARSKSIRETYLDELGKCDVYVGLFWRGYGEYTIDEFDEAKRLHKPRLIYEKRGDIQGTRDPSLAKFLDGLGKVETGLTIRWFNSRTELHGFIKEDFARLLAEAFRGRFKKVIPPVSSRPPKIPNYFVGRDQLVRQLVNQLTSAKSLALAIEGMPGVGKTTLAAAIAQDAEIEAHFEDGILWAGLGPQTDPIRVLTAWARELGVSEQLDERGAASVVTEALDSQARLLVIDDAWELESALLLRCGGAKCAHLLTTRDRIIAREFARPATFLSLPVLDDKSVVKLLSILAPDANAADSENAAALARSVGGLPLLVELIGSTLATAESSLFPGFSDVTTDTAIRLANPREWLKLATRRLGTEGQPLTLEETVKMSLRPLPREANRAFYALGAFAPQPETFSREAAETVACTDGRILVVLGARNLVDIDGTTLRLHQTIAEVARAELDPAAIDRHRAHYLALVRADPYDVWPIAEAYGQIRRAWSGQRDLAILDWLTALGPYFDLHGNWREYLDLARTCLSVAQQNDALDAVGAIKANIGVAHYYLGEKKESVEHSKAALRALEEAQDLVGQARTLHNLSMLCHLEKKYGESLEYLNHAFTLLREAEDSEGKHAVLERLAITYVALGNLAKASEFVKLERDVSSRLAACRVLPERLQVQLTREPWVERRLREHPFLLSYLDALVSANPKEDIDPALDGDLVVGVKAIKRGRTFFWRVRFRGGRTHDHGFIDELPKDFDAGLLFGEQDALWVMGVGSRPPEKERLHLQTGDGALLAAFRQRYLGGTN